MRSALPRRILIPNQPEAAFAALCVVVFLGVHRVQVAVTIDIDDQIQIKFDALRSADVVRHPFLSLPLQPYY